MYMWIGVGVGVGVLVLAGLFAAGCEVATPFRWAASSKNTGSKDTGVTLPDTGAKVVVAITHAKLGSKRGLFYDYSRNVVEALPQCEGYIGHSIRRTIRGDEAWTMTVWRDHEAIEGFMALPEHRRAMKDGMAAIMRGQFARMEWASSEMPPSWDEVKRRLKDEPWSEYGRPTESGR